MSDAPRAPLLEDKPTAHPRLKGCLNHAVTKGVLDWAPLITFYALFGALPLGLSAALALAVGVACMALTHLRSALDPLVSSPKILDVGFVATFAAFTVAGYASPAAADVTVIWSNALMDGALAAIVGVGVAVDEPFVVPYAVEMGMPAAWAKEPFIRKALSDSAMHWCYAFAAMTAVCCVAPIYRCAVVGGGADGGGCLSEPTSTSVALSAVFT